MDVDNLTDFANSDFILKEHKEIFSNLGIMAANIAFYNFQWRYIALVVCLTSQYLHTVDTFLKQYNQSVVLKTGKFKPRYKSPVPQFVLFGEETAEITEYLQWLVDMKFDNTGKFIIICYSAENKKCDENHIFKKLAEIYIVNAIFLRMGDTDDKPVPFTYHLILPDKCRNIEPERLNITNNCVNNQCFQLLYRDKLKDLHKCPLIVSTFEQPPFMYLHNGTKEPTGGDGDMLKVVTSALNATLVIKTPTDGYDWGHYENNNWTGSMGDVFNDRAHLSVCSLPLTSNKYGNFQISFIYNTMDIVWVARLPDLKPSWEKILRPFNFRARIAVTLTFLIIVFLGGFLRTSIWKKICKSFNISYTKQSILFYSWIIFLGMPIVKVTSKSAPLKIVYSWIWFCFVLRSCYQGALINSLKNKAYQSNFMGFEEVLQYKHKYGGQGSFREYFAEEKKIYDNWKQLEYNYAYKTLDSISNGTSNFVLAFNKEIVVEHLLQYNGSRRLQMIPKKIVNSPTVMYLRKYSPLAAPLNNVLSRAVESGYASLWHARFQRQRKYLFGYSKNHGIEALNIEHFTGCIVIMVLGWIVSIVFFVLEVYCGRIAEVTDD